MHEVSWIPLGIAAKTYIRETAFGDVGGDVGPIAELARKIASTGAVYALLDSGTPDAIAHALKAGGLDLAGDPDEAIVEFFNTRQGQTFLALDIWMRPSDRLPDSDLALKGVAAFGSGGLLGRSGEVDGHSLLHMRHQFGFMTAILVSAAAVPDNEIEAQELTVGTESALVDQLEGLFLTAYDGESWVAWTRL